MSCNRFTLNNNGYFTGPYYPRPFFLLPENQSGSNNVVNPVRSEEWGFFVGLPASVTSGATLPLTLSSNAGTAISQQSPNAANITTGSYQLSYSVTASSATDPMSYGIELGGTLLPFSIITAEGDGTTKTLSNSIIITSASNSTVEIVNLTAGTANVTRSTLTLTKLLN